MKPIEFFITHHARDRWRERAAPYGDEGKVDVEAAVRAARHVKDRSLIPFPTQTRMMYFLHAPSGAWFVVESIDRDSARVITVLESRCPRNYLRPKPRRPRAAAIRKGEGQQHGQ